MLDYIQGTTYHKRHGAVANAFRYSVDYILTDLETAPRLPFLFSRNAFNLASLYDKDHGGTRRNGQGVAWVRRILRDHGFKDVCTGKTLLLAQPRLWGRVFNPVSFWLLFDKHESLRLVIAEVNNTFGERHSYLCHHDDKRAITKGDTLTARKIFHVSPFQPVSGVYTFKFDISSTRIGVWIDYKDGNGGVFACFTGPREHITNLAILKSAVLRPFGALRVLTLIYYQALKLKLKGAPFRPRPLPPKHEVS